MLRIICVLAFEVWTRRLIIVALPLTIAGVRMVSLIALGPLALPDVLDGHLASCKANC